MIFWIFMFGLNVFILSRMGTDVWGGCYYSGNVCKAELCRLLSRKIYACSTIEEYKTGDIQMVTYETPVSRRKITISPF